MMVREYKKELAEMTKMWNCKSERVAIQQFLHSIYIAKGNRPEATAGFINHLSNDDLAYVFEKTMDAGHKDLGFINLLELEPVK